MESIASLDSLYLAYQKACRGKQRKAEVVRFAALFEENIRSMRRQLLDETIAVGHYRYFKIHDPKERLVCAAPFRERVLHHAIMNICHPYFDRTLIDSTYATRKGKGVYAALDHAKRALAHYRYTVKLDFRKYYDSIDHGILKMRLRRIFKDPALFRLLERIIDSYHVVEGKGLPIGNLTSQYFANLYLLELDHKATEKYKVSAYIRYMDDILMVENDSVDLKHIVQQMTSFASDALHLTFKPPVFRKAKDGQSFLGYHVMPNYCKLSGRSKRRFRSKLLVYNRWLEDGIWTERQYEEHVLPLLSFVQHAESWSFRNACLKII